MIIKKIAAIFTAIIIFSPLLWASDVQYQESQAPTLISMKSTKRSGNLLIKVYGTDSIEDQFKNKIRLYIIPMDVWDTKKDLKFIDDYLVEISNSHLVKGIKSGAYIIGISTQYSPKMTFTGAGMKLEMPNDFYSWDGWSKNPGLQTVDGKMHYTTWYHREVIPGKTSLIVAMRMKKGKNINEILGGFEPARPLYPVSVTTNDPELKSIIQVIRKYGKAFLNKNQVFFIRNINVGHLSELRIVEDNKAIVIPKKIDILDAPTSQNQLIIENGTTRDAIVRIKKKDSSLLAGEQLIPAGESGKINLTSGEYYDVVRFQSKDGAFSYSKGEGFIIEPNKYSKLMMTLHPVLKGNYHSYSCSAKDFD